MELRSANLVKLTVTKSWMRAERGREKRERKRINMRLRYRSSFSLVHDAAAAAPAPSSSAGCHPGEGAASGWRCRPAPNSSATPSLRGRAAPAGKGTRGGEAPLFCFTFFEPQQIFHLKKNQFTPRRPRRKIL